MKVTFLRLAHNTIFEKPHPQQVTPSLSVCYSAAILEKKGHETTLIDTFTDRYTKEKIIKEVTFTKPDVVIMDVNTSTSNLALKVAKSIKNRTDIPILLIGQHPTAKPETFLFENSPVDLCIREEPENTLEVLFDNFEKEIGQLVEIRGISFFDNKRKKIVSTKRRETIRDLDSLPFPKHELYMDKRYTFYFPMMIKEKMRIGFMITSRGCPYSCIFCSPALRVSYGKEYRERTEKNIVDEIEFLISKFKVNAIYFQDDNFTYDKKRVEKICDEIIKRKVDITWSAQGRVDQISKGMVKKMKKAGCSSLSFGIESGSERILKILKKGITKNQVKKAFKILKEEGILTHGDFLIGNPTETYSEMEKTLEFAKELNPDILQVCIFTPYPGSSAFKMVKEDIPFEKFTHYNDVSINLSKVPTDEIKKFHRKFYREYYLSLMFILNYLKWRLPYAIRNIDSEIRLIKSAIKFLIS
jgi:radical SAM superfamily enzyme YgiQ (UPF0313 family)